MPKSPALSLAMRTKGGKENISSPLSPLSPSSPRTAYGDAEAATSTTAYHNMPESHASPKPRKDSKSMFANFGASRSSSRLVAPETSVRQVPEQTAQQILYTNGRGAGSTPELSRPVQTPNSEGNHSIHATENGSLCEMDNRSDTAASELRSNSSGISDEAPDHNINSNVQRVPKAKKHGVLKRSKSIKIEGTPGDRVNMHPPKTSPNPTYSDQSTTWSNYNDGAPLRTAPLEKGQSWRQNIGFGKSRTQSADRHDGSLHVHRDDDASSSKDKAEQISLASSSYNEKKGSSALISSLGSNTRKMGEKMNSARKGMFGKLGRSSSNHERELQIPKEQYQFKIIHLPLVEQTRRTRISSRLADSKDKTEFWMPALPWRCIDYLNLRGCEEEGLYRVPGAAHTVKFYEQKFDQQRDVDLIADDNLNDPNVIGSMFKNWLRNLPDEIFPRAIQSRIQQECQGAKTTPQMLKDELSKLPPFNYYLLFAITCHISLLHSWSELNKMNYNNLCICFQPAIKIDAFCFQFLILDWRNCWQGCWTEKEYLVEEVKLLESPSPGPQPTTTRNGHGAPTSGKTKGSQPNSGYLGDNLKSSSGRSNSAERNKTSSRGISADRGGVSDGAMPSNAAHYTPEKSNSSTWGLPPERDASTDRAISSSDSRQTFNARATPNRGPSSVNTAPMVDEDDHSATPTQAQHATQHARVGSEHQFRLDLNNPPSSPFSLKF